MATGRGRPALRPGELGKISTTKPTSGSWQAFGRAGLRAGGTKRLKRTAPTENRCQRRWRCTPSGTAAVLRSHGAAGSGVLAWNGDICLARSAADVVDSTAARRITRAGGRMLGAAPGDEAKETVASGAERAGAKRKARNA